MVLTKEDKEYLGKDKRGIMAEKKEQCRGNKVKRVIMMTIE